MLTAVTVRRRWVACADGGFVRADWNKESAAVRPECQMQRHTTPHHGVCYPQLCRASAWQPPVRASNDAFLAFAFRGTDVPPAVPGRADLPPPRSGRLRGYDRVPMPPC